MVLPFLNVPPATHTHTPFHADTKTLATKHGKLEGQVEMLINIHQNIVLVFPGILSSNITVMFQNQVFLLLDYKLPPDLGKTLSSLKITMYISWFSKTNTKSFKNTDAMDGL